RWARAARSRPASAAVTRRRGRGCRRSGDRARRRRRRWSFGAPVEEVEAVTEEEEQPGGERGDGPGHALPGRGEGRERVGGRVLRGLRGEEYGDPGAAHQGRCEYRAESRGEREAGRGEGECGQQPGEGAQAVAGQGEG